MPARTKRLQSVPQDKQLQPQQGPGAVDVPDRLVDLAQMPLRLGSVDLMQIFQIKHARFYQLLKAGKFDRFEILPRIGRRAWSRTLVQRYLDGDVTARKFAPMAVVGRK